MDAPSGTPSTPPAPPEKYIRTFAGDMDAVKKGGTPDLTPLDTAPTTAPPSTSPETAATPLGSAPVQTPPVVAPALEESKTLSNPPLQTYSNDFSQRMKSLRASTATVLAAEQDNAPRAPQGALEEPAPMNLLYVIGGVLLLVVSVGGGIAAYWHYQTTTAPVAVAPSVQTPIFVDEHEDISLANTSLLQAVTDSMNRSLAPGTVRLLSLASTTNTENVFAQLPLSVPEILLRNIQAKGSMAGVINVGGSQSPFFILTVSSYSAVFSSMLSWEPLMPDHLSALFPPPTVSTPTVEVAAPSSSSSTPISGASATTTVALSSTTPKIAPKSGILPIKNTKSASTTPEVPVVIAGFYDAVVANHDVRVYRDTAKRDVLLYGFWNQETLVIARDSAAFTEIVGRLATAPPQ